MHSIFSLLQVQETKQVIETTSKSLEQIDDPILRILLIVLLVIIGFLLYSLWRKDKQIKEINNQLISTIKEDVNIIQELKDTFEHSAEQSKNSNLIMTRLETILNKMELKLDYVLNFKKDA